LSWSVIGLRRQNSWDKKQIISLSLNGKSFCIVVLVWRSEMKKLKKTIVTTIFISTIFGILGSLFVTFFFMRVINGNTEWGNVADWFGALGTLGGLFFVVYQIKSSEKQFLEQLEQNREQFNESHSTEFNYYFRTIANKMETSNNGFYTKRVSPVLKMLIANDGNVAGSVAFSGVCTTNLYESLDLKDMINRNKIASKTVDTRVAYGKPQPDPEFQRIEAKGTAKDWITLEEKDFQLYFPGETELTLVHTDTHGNLYPFNIHVNYDKDLLKADRIK